MRGSATIAALILLVCCAPAQGRRRDPSADFTCAPACQVAPGATVTFTASSDAAKPNYAWELSDDDPPQYDDATGATASRVFPKPGTYTIGLKVVDGANRQTASVSHTVTVTAAPPTADFTCAPSCTVDDGATITFTATSSATQPVYGWSFGDGSASGATVAHAFTFPGTYPVTLTESSTGATVEHDVTVAQTPAGQLNASLILLQSPLTQAAFGPEHGQLGAPTGPFAAPVLPPASALPVLGMHAPHGPVRAGSLVHLTVTVKGPVQDVAWDLDGDGLRNDAYGTHVAYPDTCPGTVRAEVVSKAGLHGGDQAAVRIRGTAVPKGWRTALRRSRSGSLKLGSRYGAWRHLGTAFGVRPQRGGSVPDERTLRTDGAVGGDYADTGAATGALGGWATSWHAAHGIRGLTADAAGETATGGLVSPRFTLRHRYVTFKLGGLDATCGHHAAETATLYVLRHGRPVKVRTVTPGRQEPMHQVAIRLPTRDVGATAILAVLDASSAGHVNVSGLRSPGHEPYVSPPPVVGWADTHEHLDAHQGFGGLEGVRTYMGVPGAAYATYEPAFSGSGDRMRAASTYVNDVRDSSTHFAGPLGGFLMRLAHRFLRDNNMFQAFHEQFHVTELHRAWEGGMRLISSLAISNDALQYLMSKPDAGGRIALTSDREVIEAHVAAMRELAADNADWMKIVYSPTQAHDAIADGKLAIVLGTEVDQLGTLGFATPEAEVNWLWQLGIRQVTPIHAIDNQLGGTAIFQDVYDMANDLLNRHDPAGHSTTQASTDQVTHDVEARGVEASNPAASYGDFFRTTHAGDCVGGGYSAAKPDCVSYSLNQMQIAIGLHTGCLCVLTSVLIDGPTPLIVGVNRGDTTVGDLPGIPLYDWLHTIHTPLSPATGGQNSEGLTDYGRRYIDALEHHGMLVDLEHMSDASVHDLLASAPDGAPAAQRSPAWQFAPHGCIYQIGMYRRRTEACFAQAYPFMSSHTSFRNQSLAVAQTTVKDYRRREFERTDEQIDYIDRAGGTIAPVVLQDPVNADDPAQPGRRTTVTNPDDPSLNDCAGSSKSWAEAYLWALNHTLNHRVALSTDMAVVGGTGARFDAGTSAVPTNCTASSATALDGLDISLSGASDYLLHPEDIDRDLRGGELREERYAMAQYNHAGQFNPLFYTQNPITHAGLRPDQPPVPDAATRDFNHHGMVTIGQLPDLLQDAVNAGLSPRDLDPLMHSAQSYLDMWDKAFQLNGCLDAHNAPTAIDGTRCQGATPTAATLDAGVCRNTCPNDPGDGTSLDPHGRPLVYVTRSSGR